jgi:flagellar L-ring protein precursor FlgH
MRNTDTLSIRTRLAAVLIATALVPACSFTDRISNIGGAPQLTTIENPTKRAGYQPVAMPMPRPQQMLRQPNSLWRPGARAFFRDQRAARVGDIVKVDITIEDEAQIDNETTRSRDNSEDADVTNLLGYENALYKVLPGAFDPTTAVGVGSASSSTGAGSVNRSETIKLEVAAVVAQVLPNGNMVITGSQEVRVNFEVRVLTVSGVVRPEDITAANTVKHSQIAEARISYGGRGQITDVQQPRYGQQLFDIIFPL